MKYVYAVCVLAILVGYGYPIYSYLTRDKGHSPLMVLLITSPIWLTGLAAIILAIGGD